MWRKNDNYPVPPSCVPAQKIQIIHILVTTLSPTKLCACTKNTKWSRGIFAKIENVRNAPNIARVQNCPDITIWNSLFGLFHILSFWHFIFLTFCLFDILSFWHFVFLTFYLFDILSFWQFVFLTFCLFEIKFFCLFFCLINFIVNCCRCGHIFHPTCLAKAIISLKIMIVMVNIMIMVMMVVMIIWWWWLWLWRWLTQALNVVNTCPICKQDIPTWPMKSWSAHFYKILISTLWWNPDQCFIQIFKYTVCTWTVKSNFWIQIDAINTRDDTMIHTTVAFAIYHISFESEV